MQQHQQQMQEYIKKILKSGRRHSSSSASHNMKTLIISNDEMNDIIKIVKCLETETVQNEVTEQKGRFFSMLLGTLGATLLGNILTGRGVKTSSQG